MTSAMNFKVHRVSGAEGTSRVLARLMGQMGRKRLRQTGSLVRGTVQRQLQSGAPRLSDVDGAKDPEFEKVLWGPIHTSTNSRHMATLELRLSVSISGWGDVTLTKTTGGEGVGSVEVTAVCKSAVIARALVVALRIAHKLPESEDQAFWSLVCIQY